MAGPGGFGSESSAWGSNRRSVCSEPDEANEKSCYQLFIARSRATHASSQALESKLMRLSAVASTCNAPRAAEVSRVICVQKRRVGTCSPGPGPGVSGKAIDLEFPSHLRGDVPYSITLQEASKEKQLIFV